MRVVGYIRVSTDEQVKEGHSLEAQRDRLINYCKSQDDWNLINIYAEEGQSAKDMERPQLKRLLEDAENGEFDVVLVYRLDRLTRSVMDLYELLKTFEKHNVKFKSATEVYDTTTAMGKLFITIVAALAQWERENLSERVRFGMEQLIRDGKWHGGPIPYGYEIVDEVKLIIPSEQAVLIKLRDLYMDGNGFGKISRTLNELGLKRRGFAWSAQTVWYVLNNPLYAGKVMYGTKKKNGKYATRKKDELVDVIWGDSDFPPIYTWEEYEEHSARMKKRSFYGVSKKREYWFAGIIRCGRCGQAMVAKPYANKKKDDPNILTTVNYICSSRSQQRGCHLPLLRQNLLVDLLYRYIESIRLSQDMVSAAVERSKDEKKDFKNELDHYNKELKLIEERRKKWQYMFAEDLMSLEDFRKRKIEEDEREATITAVVDDIRAKDIGTNVQNIDAILDLPELWEIIEDADKKAMAQNIFETIYVDCEVESGKGIARKGKSLPFYIKEIKFN